MTTFITDMASNQRVCRSPAAVHQTTRRRAVQYEEFVAAHLKCGRSIFDLFPATPEYERWMAVGRPPIKYTLRSQLAGARRSMASP